ncbi:aminoacyl-tRNA hydrolase [Candidatus Aerophobetes bacterium]|nr:aminoacyl-tRNA hydrolase [Candidatus Aerophobetes bacterium]
MKVIFGLGNPGPRYERTRHNVGFLIIDALAQKHGIKVKDYACHCLVGEVRINGKALFLAKPLTYMNLAGIAAKEILEKVRGEVKDILVITDDADLEMGRIKIAGRGGDAGHLGVRSVIENLGSKDFPRVRVGIGRPPEKIDLAEYVLQEFTEDEWVKMKQVFSRATEAIETLVLEGIEKAMQRYN